MKNQRKFQVFISSTFTDLIEERKKILNVLLMADCIPAGMEMFVATDDEQFEVIKRVIDLCDYYILIIGRRYGSINATTEISYTEMEYNYAKEIGVPVLVFALDEAVELDSNKIDDDETKINKLKKFREKALDNRLASMWRDQEDLVGKVAISIMKAKVDIERPGWQRAVEFDEATLRREIMELESKNKELNSELLKSKIKLASFANNKDLEFENVEITIEYYYYSASNYQKWDKKVYKLPELFVLIATELLDVALAEISIQKVIENNISKNSIYFKDKQIVKIVLNQLKALNLMYSFWSENKSSLFWGLTEKGAIVRNDAILFKKKID